MQSDQASMFSILQSIVQQMAHLTDGILQKHLGLYGELINDDFRLRSLYRVYITVYTW